MVLPASPLADQFASLRVAFAASPHGGWLPPALHALISACLARIFGRLEQLLMLWQAGNFAALPALPARPHAVNPCEIRNLRVHPSHTRQHMQPRDHRAALAPAAAASAPNRAARPRIAPSPIAQSLGTASARSPRRLRAARDPPPRPSQPLKTPPSDDEQACPKCCYIKTNSHPNPDEYRAPAALCCL